MPKTKMFPYPLEPGTHVVAKVRRLDLTADETIVGTVVRVIRRGSITGGRPAGSNGVSYAIQTKSGGLVEALASRTTPVDTSTPEGLDRWLDAMDGPEPDPTLLPGPDSAGAEALRNLLFDGSLAPVYRPGVYEPPVQHSRWTNAIWADPVDPYTYRSIQTNTANPNIRITDV